MIRRSASGAAQEANVSLAQLLAPLLLRLRLRKACVELLSGGIGVLAAFVLYEVLRASIRSAAILSAVQPLFIFSGLAIAVIFLARATRKVTLAHAANEADTRANLYDELKTASWLAARGDRSSLESLQMQRADVTARRLQAPKLMPPIPRLRMALLLLLALLVGMLMQLAPGSLRLAPERMTQPALGKAGDTVEPAEQSERAEKSASETKVAISGEPENASMRVNTASTDSDLNAQDQDVVKEEAGGSRDSIPKQQGEEGLEAVFVAKGEHEDIAPPARGGDPLHPSALSGQADTPVGMSPQSQSSVERSTGTGEAALDTVFDRLSESARRVADGGGENALTGAAEAKQKADDGESGGPVQRNITKGDGQSSEGAAAPMSGQMQGEGAQGQGQGLPAEGSAASQHSGQMPEFATLTTTGGFGSPKASPIPGLKGLEPDPSKVAQIKRSEAQPRLVNIDASTGDSVRATDDFFTATRWQQSQLELQVRVPAASYSQGQTMEGERVPLALRSTVKSYFLILQQERK